MELFSTNIAHIALKPILARQLQEAIRLSKEIIRRDKVSDLSCKGYLSKDIEQPQTVPLNRINQGTSDVEYVSAIALRLSRLPGELAVDVAQTIDFQTIAAQTTVPQTIVAQTIGAYLNNSIKAIGDKAVAYQSLSDALWRNFTVKVVPSGWIYLQLSDLGLASWLQILTEQSVCLGDRFRHQIVHENDNQLLRNSTKLFELQHTHARCCSQIYLAQQIGLLSLSDNSSGFSPSGVQFRSVLAPKPFPWLDSRHLLRFQHPTEHQLISQLVATIDTLSDASSQPSILKVGGKLSQNFIKFHAACRIFSEGKTVDLELAQARLGIVLATQAVLKTLLEEGLGVVAPTEL